jgi:competence protein ComEC
VTTSSLVSTPIVPIAAALIVGAACGGACPTPGTAGVGVGGALTLALVARRRPKLATTFVAAAALALGAAAQGVVYRDAGRRIETTFGGASSRELSLLARVAAAPERNDEGGRSLEVVSEPSERMPALRLRLDLVHVPDDDAGRIDRLRRGDTVSLWCRLRAPAEGPGTTVADARRRLAAQRLDATGRVKSSRLVQVVSAGPSSLGRTMDALRVHARGALDGAFGPTGDVRAVLGAMLLGDRLLLREPTNALLRDAGLVHILSISGLHTTITVVLLLALLRRTGLGARGLLFTGGASLLAFSAFVGHGASVWRACAGIAVGLLARVLGRDVDPIAALAVAAAGLVVAVPSLAQNAGFVLSVTATAGILAARPRLAAGARRPSVLARSLAASSGAYLATAPLLAALFGRLAPAALVANLAAAPLCAAVLTAGASAMLCATIPLAGTVTAVAARASVDALLLTSRWAAAIPGGHLRVAAPPAALLAAYVALLLVWASWNDAWSRRTLRAIRFAFGLLAIALHLGPPPPGRGPSRVEVVDVGQGLAVVLRGPDGRFMLVDAGPSGRGRFDVGDRIVIPSLVSRGCHRLEVFALSHDHEDHAGGAFAVLRDLEVGELWVAAGSERDPVTRRVIADAVARGVAIRRLRRGDTVPRAGFNLRVLHPGLEDRARSVNDRCLALRARAEDGASVVLPGDLESGGEAALLAAGEDPAADALVAPHHGADGSSTVAFLARVAPKFVLVSAGRENRFGHPGGAALARFAVVAARVLRTDVDGTIGLEDVGGRWMASIEQQRNRDEREDEDASECDGDREASGAERLGLVDEAGMAVSQDEQDAEPEAVGGWCSLDDRLCDDERRDSADRRPRHEAMAVGPRREDRVTAVQLPYGE